MTRPARLTLKQQRALEHLRLRLARSFSAYVDTLASLNLLKIEEPAPKPRRKQKRKVSRS